MGAAHGLLPAFLCTRRLILPQLQSQALLVITPTHQVLHARHLDACTEVGLNPALARFAWLRTVHPLAAACAHFDAFNATRRATALVTRIARIFGEEWLRATSI